MLANLYKLNIEIRKCCKCEGSVLNYPQPGYWSGKILFIFQNPAYPKKYKTEDCIIMNKKSSDIEFRNAYMNTIKTSKVMEFIRRFGLELKDVSITNIVKCPTEYNKFPNDDVVKNCYIYALTQIAILKPKLIIFVGKLSKQTLEHYVKGKYKYFVIPHYSILLKTGKIDEYVSKLKPKIVNALETNELSKYI